MKASITHLYLLFTMTCLAQAPNSSDEQSSLDILPLLQASENGLLAETMERLKVNSGYYEIKKNEIGWPVKSIKFVSDRLVLIAEARNDILGDASSLKNFPLFVFRPPTLDELLHCNNITELIVTLLKNAPKFNVEKEFLINACDMQWLDLPDVIPLDTTHFEFHVCYLNNNRVTGIHFCASVLPVEGSHGVKNFTKQSCSIWASTLLE